VDVPAEFGGPRPESGQRVETLAPGPGRLCETARGASLVRSASTLPSLRSIDVARRDGGAAFPSGCGCRLTTRRPRRPRFFHRERASMSHSSRGLWVANTCPPFSWHRLDHLAGSVDCNRGTPFKAGNSWRNPGGLLLYGMPRSVVEIDFASPARIMRSSPEYRLRRLRHSGLAGPSNRRRLPAISAAVISSRWNGRLHPTLPGGSGDIVMSRLPVCERPPPRTISKAGARIPVRFGAVTTWQWPSLQRAGQVSSSPSHCAFAVWHTAIPQTSTK